MTEIQLLGPILDLEAANFRGDQIGNLKRNSD